MPLPRLFAALFLLLLLAGCSKKDDPAASTGTGSYQLDGTPVSCQSRASTSTASSGGVSSDYLFVQLTTTPQPAAGSQVLRLGYYKPTGQPASAYQLTDIWLQDSANPNGESWSVVSNTLTANGSTSFSGTFAGKIAELVGSTYQTTHTISAGTFANARL